MIHQDFNLAIVFGMAFILGAATASGQGFKREAADIFTEANTGEPAIVTEADLDDLPEIV